MTPRYDILIVGAGHAGAQAAIALRHRKFAGTIALLGDEPDPPYERPPLSKEYLAGDKPFERLLIRPTPFWKERQIDMLLGQRVVSVDAEAHRVTLSDGRSIAYGSLIWAAGATSRRLACAGHDLARLHTIRNRADVDRLIAELPHVSRVVVVGGGYIGLEAAAVLTGLGKHVEIVEAQKRVLARVAGDALSRFYEIEHRARGVGLRLGVSVEAVEGRDGAVAGVRLDDGTRLDCEMAIVGIGIIPAIDALRDAGAAGTNGVDVDENCRTSLGDIFAIGDCAAHLNRFAGGGLIRLESVQNANDQATIVAKALTGEAEAYDAVPWFWSNQFDLKLQTVGLSQGHDDAVVRGNPANRTFSVVYLKDRRVIALDCVNNMRDFVQGRALVTAGTKVDPARLVDADVSLKQLAAVSTPADAE